MKKLVLFTLVMSLLVSCSALNPGSEYKPFSVPQKGFVASANPPVSAYNAGSVGDEVGSLSAKVGDSLMLIGEKRNTWGRSYYTTIHNNDTVYVQIGKVMSERNWGIENQGLIFWVPKDKDALVWAAANNYVSNHSSMKIQTQTEYLIETYNPISEGQIGYKVTRQPKASGLVQYEVVANRKAAYNDDSIQKSKEAAYSIQHSY